MMMLRRCCCCCLLFGVAGVQASLRLEWLDWDDTWFEIYDDYDKLLFQSDDIRFYHHNRWCTRTNGLRLLNISTNDDDNDDTTTHSRFLGLSHRTIAMEWQCDDVPLRTTIQTYDDTNSILFQTVWPEGAIFDTDTPNPDDARMHFPSLKSSFHQHAFSWQGSFMRGIHDISVGSTGAPVVFYDDDLLDRIVVVSPMFDGIASYKSYTAGGHGEIYTPGISGRIRYFPTNYTQSILMYQSSTNTGMVGGLYEWGSFMQEAADAGGTDDADVVNPQESDDGVNPQDVTKQRRKLYDVTLDTIGYQTDNGAYYCFCRDANCSSVLSSVVHSLENMIQYVSFQGAGASSGDRAAPWCVSKWGVDGGLGPMYPTPMKEFQEDLKVPLQLYIPYFCPDSPYFDDDEWQSVASDPTLPGCGDYDFRNVHPDQSLDFYRQLFDRGVQVGMTSFESDFMNQNYNCMFTSDCTSADRWMSGMGNAATERNITVQWCYATASDVLMSTRFPSVTQFRVSDDFCYGTSWKIGLSSLLVGALGAAPSKDTLWTTVNDRFEVPGCPWTRDHEAIQLHAVLALLSTGPVGISDAYGQTDRSILHGMINARGQLLKPSRAIAAVDTTFVDGFLKTEENGYVYGTHMEGSSSWIFVSFMLTQPYHVQARDFWPRRRTDSKVVVLQRSGVPHGACREMVVDDDPIVLPAASFFNVTAASDMEPTLTYVWTSCERWTLLGELTKYVPLSPQRFGQIECHQDGVSATVMGSVGEIVPVTAVFDGTCMTEHVVIMENGQATVRFGGVAVEV